MTRAAAAVIALAACGRGVSVTVVTVDARPAVKGAAKLEVVLANGGATLTQDFDLHGHTFPTQFSVSTPGRTGAITFVAQAFDDSGAIVGVGNAAATIVPDDETDVTLLLDPADFQVNTQYPGAQRTVFYLGTGGRQLAATGDGTFTVTWSDDCGSLGRCDEWGRRFDKDGNPVTTALGADQQFNVNRSNIFGTDPASVIGSDGSLLVVWTTWDEVAGDPGAIVCSAIAPDGSAASPVEVTLSDGTSADHPGIAEFQGVYAVVWQEDQSGTGTPVIRLRFVDKTCTPVSAAQTASMSSSPAPTAPAISTNLDGSEAAIVWLAADTIHARLMTGTSALGAEQVPVSVAGDTLWAADLSPADGGYALVYGRQGSAGPFPSGAFVLHRMKTGGGAQGVDTVIANGLPDISSAAAVAHRKDGALAVSWSNCGAAGDGDGCGVLAQLVRPTGAPVGDPIVVDTTTTGDQTDPSIVALPDAFAVAWTDASMKPPDTSLTGIRARVIYPPYDDARGVPGAACGGSAPCNTGLVCAQGSDGADRCYATCDPLAPPPLCPNGGACTQGNGAAACVY